MRKSIIVSLIALVSIGIFVSYYVIKGEGNKTSETPQKPQEKVQITVSLFPFQQLAQRIGGENVEVINIVPPGIEPHEYEPTPQDVVRIRGSQIFVYNGFPNIETWVPKVLPGLTNTTIIKGSELIKNGLDEDPHYWLDIDANIQVAERIAAVLAEKDPLRAAQYQENVSKLKTELRKIDGDYMAQLKVCNKREVIVAHDAFGYLSRRYKFIAHPIAGLSPEAEPEPRTIADLIKLVQDRQIKYVLFEELASPKLAMTITQETGATPLVLNPLEGLTEENIREGQTLFTLMEQNLSVLRKVMDCKL